MFYCKRLTVCLFLLILVGNLTAQTRTDRKLQQKIDELVKSQKLRGVAGIYVKNLRTGKVAAYQADTLFPTASIVKVPILVGIMDKIEKGELQYHQQLEYKDSLLYAGYTWLFQKRRENRTQQSDDVDADHERQYGESLVAKPGGWRWPDQSTAGFTRTSIDAGKFQNTGPGA